MKKYLLVLLSISLSACGNSELTTSMYNDLKQDLVRQYAEGLITDKELAEKYAVIHKKRLSSIRANGLIKEMEDGQKALAKELGVDFKQIESKEEISFGQYAQDTGKGFLKVLFFPFVVMYALGSEE